MGYPDAHEAVILGGGEGSAFTTAQYAWAYYMDAALQGVPRKKNSTTTTKIDYKPNSAWKFVGGNGIQLKLPRRHSERTTDTTTPIPITPLMILTMAKTRRQQ